VTVVWAGLSLGAVYALVAVGYNIVFAASGIFNFAQAQLLMLGTFVAYWGLAQLGWPAAVVFALCGVIVGAVALLEERLAVRLVRGQHAQLVTTVGVATVLSGATQLIWGGDPLTVPFLSSDTVWTIFGGRIEPVEVLLIVVAVAIPLALLVYGRASMIGLATLATAEDRESAMLRGINVRMVALGAFVVAGILAGLLGPIVGPKTFAVSTLGSSLALKGFVALAIGGFGSIAGGVVGGFAIGLLEQLSARYVSVNSVNLLVFAALITLLLVRPAGLFGRVGERVV
jgi:branched-chain amino acid transport system permease protein